MAHPADLQKIVMPTPLGDMLLAASKTGLVGAWFVQGQQHAPDPKRVALWPTAKIHDSPSSATPESTILRHATGQLAQYFSGQLMSFDLPLDPSNGTAFQQSVWREISRTAYANTTTYGNICQRLHKPTAARAVGAAVGKNPLSIIIPCHRVLGSTGQLTGYAGGLERKVALLKLERMSHSS